MTLLRWEGRSHWCHEKWPSQLFGETMYVPNVLTFLVVDTYKKDGCFLS